MREYTLDAKTLARYKRGGVTKCRRCGEEFEVGQRVVSRHIGKGRPSVPYHKECYDEMLYE